MSTFNSDDTYQDKWDELYYDALDKELNKGMPLFNSLSRAS